MNMNKEQIIELETVIVEEELLVITSRGTCYSNERLQKIPDLNDLMVMYKKLLMKARGLGVVVSYRSRLKSRILELIDLVPAEKEKYELLFEKHKEFWLAELDSGRTFTLEQVQHFDGGYELRNQMWALFYRSQPLGKVMDVASRLKDINAFLDNLDNCEGARVSF